MSLQLIEIVPADTAREAVSALLDRTASTLTETGHDLVEAQVTSDRGRVFVIAEVQGEADLVESLLRASGGTRVLDAGCGTGRVAIELAGRGFSVVGVDADPAMLTVARDKAPELRWVQADLVDTATAVPDEFDVVVLAGNVMIFLDQGTESTVVAQLADRLTPGGVLVAGFQLLAGRLTLQRYEHRADLLAVLAEGFAGGRVLFGKRLAAIEPGQGAAFTVRLPRSGPPEQPGVPG